MTTKGQVTKVKINSLVYIKLKISVHWINKTELPHDPEIPPLGYIQKNWKRVLKEMFVHSSQQQHFSQ